MVECIIEEKETGVWSVCFGVPKWRKKSQAKPPMMSVGRSAIPNLDVTFSVLPVFNIILLLTYRRLHPAESKSARVAVAAVVDDSHHLVL